MKKRTIIGLVLMVLLTIISFTVDGPGKYDHTLVINGVDIQVTEIDEHIYYIKPVEFDKLKALSEEGK